MYYQQNIDYYQVLLRQSRYKNALSVWNNMPIKQRQKHLQDLSYNKVYAHRCLDFLPANIREDIIDAMNLCIKH